MRRRREADKLVFLNDFGDEREVVGVPGPGGPRLGDLAADFSEFQNTNIKKVKYQNMKYSQN